MLPKNWGEPMGAPAIFKKQIEIKLLHPASTEEVPDSGENHSSASSPYLPTPPPVVACPHEKITRPSPRNQATRHPDHHQAITRCHGRLPAR
ncbi:MAG: hypothetical protein P8X89_21975 [Reinekea sp.]